MGERTRAELTGAIRDVDALFRGRLQLSPQGTVTHEGRTAWRYVVTLGPEGDTGTAPLALPALAEPKGGRDETTKRRLAFFDARTPKSLSGEVLVDAATSVVLKARLDGRITVPANEAGGAAELRMVLDSALSEIGQAPAPSRRRTSCRTRTSRRVSPTRWTALGFLATSPRGAPARGRARRQRRSSRTKRATDPTGVVRAAGRYRAAAACWKKFDLTLAFSRILDGCGPGASDMSGCSGAHEQGSGEMERKVRQ